MPKLKLIIIGSMIVLFSIFSGLQVAGYFVKSWFTGFIVTLIFFTAVFLIQTLFYIAISKKLVKQGNACKVDYNKFVGSPLEMNYLRGAELFAVSQEDAKKMASAFIESWEIQKVAEIHKCIVRKKEYENKVV